MKTAELDFRPFRAWRYDAKHVALDQVIAPPYDVISPQERETLYQQSPFNVVRLILGKETDFHEQAAKRWQEWTQKGALTQDPSPVFYLYEQTFHHLWSGQLLKRRALVGLLNLAHPEAVLAHEHTFSAPKKDRLLLLEKTKTNLSPIFGLYENSKNSLAGLFASYEKKPPLFEASDTQGSIHRGWAIQNREEQQKIHETLSRGNILIADGHHRFETAVEYRRQMREKFPQAPPDSPFDFVMIALVEFSDEGLLMLPTHRIVKSFAPSSKKEFLDRAKQYFDFVPAEETKLFERLEKRPRSEKVFGGFFGAEGNFLLRLKDPKAVRSLLPAGKPDLWYENEANLLSYFVFDRLWGTSGEARQGLIEYTRSWEEAASAVRQGKAEAAFLMRSPEVADVLKLAEEGERMPQKTTYFYPKLASGLFFYHHKS